MTRARKALLFLLAVAALPALPLGRASADDLADEADVQFELGAKKYQAGDYLGALEHFMVSNRLVPNKNVLFNIARCYEQLHRYPDAYRAYERALEAETDPQKQKPLSESLDRIAPKVGILEVTTDPPGATVYLDRKDLGPRGQTPRKLGLDKGKYKVIVELPGYEPASGEASVDIGQSGKLSLKLEPILASLNVSGEAGAVLRLDRDDGPALCTLPCTVQVPPGHHVLHLAKEGFKKSELPVDLAPKSLTNVRARMDVLTGAVVVNADVPSALVEIDGKPYGFTPAVLQVPVGAHTMTVSRSGFKAVTQKLTVKLDEQTRVEATLTEVSEVVAASRTQEAVEDAPSSVSIVPSIELRGMGYPTIAEALRGVRGVYLSDDRHYVTVGFRGFSRPGDYGNRVLVLVDGHPTNDDYIGSSYVGYDARTDIEDVERIEVVRGPGSVLYGTGAFFGVINLVTRSRALPTRVEAQVSTADESVARARVAANYRFNPDTGVWMSFGGARGFGRDLQFDEFKSDPATSGVAHNLDTFDAGTAQGRFFWKALTVQWFWTERKKTLPTGAFDVIFGDPRTAFRDRRAFVEARFEPKIGERVQSFTRAHYNLYDFRGTYAYAPEDGGVEVEAFTGQWVGLEQRLEMALHRTLRFTVGGELQRHFDTHQHVYDEIGSTRLDRNDPFTVGAGYGLLDWTPLSALKVSAGARYDWYSNFGGSANPRLALILKPLPTDIIKLMAGKAFRAPSVYELYHADITQKASGTLAPEKVWSGELEYSHRFTPLVVGTVSAWGNYVTDLVTLGGAGTLDDPNVYTNLDRPVLTTGVDAEIRRDFRDGWMLAAQGTLQRARYLQNDDGLYREVPNSPNVLGSVRGTVPIFTRALSLTSRVSYVGPRWDRYDRRDDPVQGHTEAAFIWDLVFGGEAERTGVRYAIGVYNVFDWRWTAPVSREFTQRSMIQNGRTLFASLTLSL